MHPVWKCTQVNHLLLRMVVACKAKLNLLIAMITVKPLLLGTNMFVLMKGIRIISYNISIWTIFIVIAFQLLYPHVYINLSSLQGILNEPFI